MTTLKEAEQIVQKNMPDGTEIKAVVEQDGEYLFLAVSPDPLEGRFDPFVKVNQTTGEFRDFSPPDYTNSREILDSFREQAESNDH